MPGRAGRRQRRIARRKREILDAAARVFAEKGYAKTTTREIADAADIAEGTLYNYFGGKREILCAIAEDMQTTMRAILQDIDQTRGRTDMVALVEAAYDDLAHRLPFLRVFLNEAWVDDVVLEDYAAKHLQRMAQQIQTLIARRVQAGTFRPIDPTLTATLVLGVVTAPIFPALRGLAEFPSPEERHTLAEAVVDLLLDGVRVREGDLVREG